MKIKSYRNSFSHAHFMKLILKWPLGSWNWFSILSTCSSGEYTIHYEMLSRNSWHRQKTKYRILREYAIPKINMLHNLSCCETRFRLLCHWYLFHSSLNLAFRQCKLHNIFIFGMAYWACHFLLTELLMVKRLWRHAKDALLGVTWEKRKNSASYLVDTLSSSFLATSENSKGPLATIVKISKQ